MSNATRYAKSNFLFRDLMFDAIIDHRIDSGFRILMSDDMQVVKLNVVTAKTLCLIFRRLLIPQIGALLDVTPRIQMIASIERCKDMMTVNKWLWTWILRTDFRPKPHHAPSHPILSHPVIEYIMYHDKTYWRPRHCMGIVLATIVFLPCGGFDGVPVCRDSPDRMVAVVWTSTRKAYLYERKSVSDQVYRWQQLKILNRQDDPFTTWIRHLDGAHHVFEERKLASSHGLRPRSAHQMFYDSVIPYYGRHHSLRNSTRMRSIEHDHEIWEVIRTVSYLLPICDEDRLTWERM